MIKKEFQIKFPEGLHARPAGQFAKLAAQFKSKINIEKGDKNANGKSIMSILTLGIQPNETIALTIEGEDGEAAMEALGRFLEEV